MASRLAVAALTGSGVDASVWNQTTLTKLLQQPSDTWLAGLEPSAHKDRLTQCGLVKMPGFDVLGWARRHVKDRLLNESLNQLLPAGQSLDDAVVSMPLPQGLVLHRGGGTKPRRKRRHRKSSDVRAVPGSPHYRGFTPLDADIPPICDIPVDRFLEDAVNPRLIPVCMPVIEGHLRTYGLVSSEVEQTNLDMGPHRDPRVDEVVQEVRIKAWQHVQQIRDTAKGEEQSLHRYLKTMAANLANSWLRTHGFVPTNVRRPECRRRTVNGKRVCYSYATCVCAACRQEGTCWVRPIQYEWDLLPLSLDRDSDTVGSFYGGIAAPDGSPVSLEGSRLPEGAMDAIRAVPNYDLLLDFYADVPDEELAAARNVTPAAIRQARHRAMSKAVAVAESFTFPHWRQGSPATPSQGHDANHADDADTEAGAER